MTERRFLVDPADLPGGPSGRTDGGTILLGGGEHHHLSRVLRLAPGDEVSLFDGRGRGWFGTIESIDRQTTRIRLTRSDDRAVEPSCRVTLIQGIPHHDRMDLIVQKTTEIGVARILPVITRRTVVRARGPGAAGRLARWRRIAQEASRQSGRLAVPEVCDPIAWQDVDMDRLGAQMGFLLSPAGAAAGPPVRPDLGRAADGASIAVGPEGGFSEEEEAAALARGFIPVSLGPRILRTETAGMVAVALVLFLAGEMGSAGRFRSSGPSG